MSRRVIMMSYRVASLWRHVASCHYDVMSRRVIMTSCRVALWWRRVASRHYYMSRHYDVMSRHYDVMSRRVVMWHITSFVMSRFPCVASGIVNFKTDIFVGSRVVAISLFYPARRDVTIALVWGVVDSNRRRRLSSWRRGCAVVTWPLIGSVCQPTRQ